jgi:membrane protease subunit (stomatin/prohibitin family)
MGLIKAIMGAAGGVLADQWKEFFICESLPPNVLMTKGQKRVGNRSSNTKGSDNIITKGSGIVVADGQCMLIVDQGKIVEVCAEPGEFVYDSSTEPSIFAGSLGEGIKESFKAIGKRFTYGGDTGKDQRVYYINTKELIDNKFGTPSPIPFRVVDNKIGLDIDVSVRCSGVYSYKIADPLLFYRSLAGNVSSDYTRDQIETQLKTEFISALQPAFGRLSDLEIRPNQIVSHNTELENALNEVLSDKWYNLRGLTVVSVALGSVTLPEEDAQMIKEAQRTAIMRDPTMAAATLVGAQADAMKGAANNSAGAMTGFMGMGMAMNAGGGMNASNLFAMGQQGQAQNPQMNQQMPQGQMNQQAPAGGAMGGGDSWKCSCGNMVQGSKFCPECGAKKPEPAPSSDGWTCSCGAFNKGKFCAECGTKKPAGAPQYKCDKCGWEPPKGSAPPKFCPECGDPFDNNDIIN